MNKVSIVNMGESFQVVDDHPDMGFSSGVLRVIELKEILDQLGFPKKSLTSEDDFEEIRNEVISSLSSNINSPWDVYWCTDPNELTDPYMLIEECAMMGYQVVIIDIDDGDNIMNSESQFDSGPYLH